MNILHISPYFPSLDANHAGGVCMGKQIEELRKHHNVYILTFAASEFDKKLKASYESDDRYASISINRWTRLFHIATEPWMPAYFAARSSFRFAWKLIHMVRAYKIDAIHAEYASMGQYMWIKRLYPHLKFHLTEHDMTAQSYERKLQDLQGVRKAIFAWQLKLVLKREKHYCQKADKVFTFNQKDRRLIATSYNRSDCMVLNPYYGIEDELLETPLDLDVKLPGNVCFLGQMGREENAQAAMRLIRIAERLKPQFPELQVYIVGNQPSEELKAKENDYIHVTGFVDDVDIYLRQAQLAVFPLTLGAGIKLKVLRSLAMGTPVITSSVGAEGIDEEAQVISLAETEEEFEKQMIRYLKNQRLCEEKSCQSRAFVKERFGWHVSEKTLKLIYK